MRLLEDAAHKYQEIRSYEYSAVATRPLKGGLTGKVRVTGGYTSPEMTPTDLPVPVLDAGRMELIGVFDEQGKPVRLELHYPAMLVVQFHEIAWRVTGAKVTGMEAVKSHACQVVAVWYEDNRYNPNGEPMRYWIDTQTHLIWKMQFSEVDALSKTGELARWTVTWDSWVENQAPPSWLIDTGKKMTAEERPALIGREAPEISGESMAGGAFQFSKLKGKVVVLDFWGTWCGPCSEEMAVLERLKLSLADERVEIWSVTEDSPEAAKRWLTERGHTLPTVIVPASTAFRLYGIESLPQVVIVDPQGKVAHQWAGLKKETDLRAAINELTPQ